MLSLEKFMDGWPTGKYFLGAHEWGQWMGDRRWVTDREVLSRCARVRTIDGWPTGKYFSGAYEWKQSIQKRLLLVCRNWLYYRKADVSGLRLMEVRHYNLPTHTPFCRYLLLHWNIGYILLAKWRMHGPGSRVSFLFLDFRSSISIGTLL